MSDKLPRGWSLTHVADIFRSHGGGTPNRNISDYWNGNIPWVSSGDIKTDTITGSSEQITRAGLENSSAALCPRFSVLVVVRSGILKHTLPVALLHREAAINQDIKCFDCGNPDLNRWLALAWRAAADDLLSRNREGTTVQSVKTETLNDFPLHVPPQREQRRIFTKLDKLLPKVDACKKRLDRIPILLKRFRQAVLAAACSGRLTADWRNLHDLNVNHWREMPVEQLLAEPLSNGRSVPDAEQGFPVLRLTCLKNGRIDLAQRKVGAWTADAAKGFRVAKGDFFLSRGNGSRSLVGRGALVEDKPDAVAFPDTLIRIRARPDIITPEFLRLVWNAKPMRDQIESAAHTTAGIWKISQTDVKGFRLPVPSLFEQKEIVHRVEELFALADQIEARYQKAKGHVEELTQSILAKAFRGELVPQDPNDEPAEKLLERIRHERTASANSRPQRRASRKQA